MSLIDLGLVMLVFFFICLVSDVVCLINMVDSLVSYVWMIVLLVFGGVFFDVYDLMMLLYGIDDVVCEFGLMFVLIGLVGLVIMIGMIFGSLVGGWLMDWIGCY